MSLEANSPRILLLDDEGDIVDLCADALKNRYQVVKTSSPFEAISLIDSGRDLIDLVICDYHMPGMTGVEFVLKLRSLGINTPAILYSGGDIEEESDQFIKILEKPFRPKALLDEVHNALSNLQKEVSFQKSFGGVLQELEYVSETLVTHFKSHDLNNYQNCNWETAQTEIKNPELRHLFYAWLRVESLKQKFTSEKKLRGERL